MDATGERKGDAGEMLRARDQGWRKEFHAVATLPLDVSCGMETLTAKKRVVDG